MIVHHVPPNRLDPLAKQQRERRPGNASLPGGAEEALGGRSAHDQFPPFAEIPPIRRQSAISRNQPYHAKLARARFGTVSCIQPEWNLLVTSCNGVVVGGS